METRLLLVEDNPGDLLLISEGLRQRWEGLVSSTTASAEEALELLSLSSYDVVVTDVRLPGMDGIRFAAQIIRAWPDTPVFLMTAFGLSRKDEGLQAGASAYLQKPLDLDLLVGRMKAALEKGSLRSRVREMNLRSSQLSRERARDEAARKDVREFFRSTELLIALLRQSEPLTDFEWEVLKNCSLQLRSFLSLKESRDTRQAEQDSPRGSDDGD